MFDMKRKLQYSTYMTDKQKNVQEFVIFYYFV